MSEQNKRDQLKVAEQQLQTIYHYALNNGWKGEGRFSADQLRRNDEGFVRFVLAMKLFPQLLLNPQFINAIIPDDERQQALIDILSSYWDDVDDLFLINLVFQQISQEIDRQQPVSLLRLSEYLYKHEDTNFNHVITPLGKSGLIIKISGDDYLDANFAELIRQMDTWEKYEENFQSIGWPRPEGIGEARFNILKRYLAWLDQQSSQDE